VTSVGGALVIVQARPVHVEGFADEVIDDVIALIQFIDTCARRPNTAEFLKG
jgi:hypothetical protein